MNTHKNSFENVIFVMVVYKNYHHNFEQKNQVFKDYGRDIRSFSCTSVNGNAVISHYFLINIHKIIAKVLRKSVMELHLV